MDLYTVEFKLPGEDELRREEVEAESESEARTIIDRKWLFKIYRALRPVAAE